MSHRRGRRGPGGRGWLQTTPFTPVSCKLPMSDVISWRYMCPLSLPVIIFKRWMDLDKVFWCPCLLGPLFCLSKPRVTSTLHPHFLGHLPSRPLYDQMPRKVPYLLHAQR